MSRPCKECGGGGWFETVRCQQCHGLGFIRRPDDKEIVRILNELNDAVDLSETRGETRKRLISLKEEAAKMAQQLSYAP